MMNDANSHIDPELLDRYLAGECSATEKDAVSAWVSVASEREQLLRALQGNRRWHERYEREPDVERWFAKFEADVLQTTAGKDERGETRAVPTSADVRRGVGSVLPTAPRRSAGWGSWMGWDRLGRVAGVAAMAVVVGAVWLWQSDARNHKTFAGADRAIVTRPGERATFTLSDGSQVMLGPSSTLTVPSGFGDRHRQLELQGAGYFSVTHTASTPFVVRVGRSNVRVLGTAFGVRDYPEDRYTTVAVRTGRVAIVDTGANPNGMQLIAGANDVAQVDSAGTTMIRGAQDVATLLAWSQGRLVFRDAQLRTVLPELERWYNVTFNVKDSAIESLLLTASFDNQSIEDLPHALSVVLNVRVTRQGRVITLSPWS